MKQKHVKHLKKIVRELNGIIREAETEEKPRRKLQLPKGADKKTLLKEPKDDL